MRNALVAWTAAALLIVAPAPAFAQPGDVAGEWRIEFGTPSGPIDMTMYVSQTGSKLNGYLTNEIGEFPLTGNVDKDQVRIAWEMPDVGSLLQITFSGKVEGDKLEGTAKIEKVGEGPMEGRRTGR
jgi:hypothetical protein